MKKIIVIFLFAIYSAFSFSQDTSAVIIQDQAIKYTNFQLFSDSVRFSGIGGSGSVLRITEDGWVYIDAGTQDTLIDTSQVVNLNKYLNLKQDAMSSGDNINISGVAINLDNFIRLDSAILDSILRVGNYVQVGYTSAPESPFSAREDGSSANSKRFDALLYTNGVSDNNDAVIKLQNAATGSAVIWLRAFSKDFIIKTNDDGSTKFEIEGVEAMRINNNSSITISEDYTLPLSDGTNKQVLKTDGSGNIAFSGVGALLTAGTGITISNDTISSTATGSDGDWTINGNYVYNLSDSIGIGVSDPSVALEINGRAKITNIQTGLTVTNTGASSAINLISNVAGNAMTVNNYDVDSVSNDATLAGNDANDLVSEQAVKGYVDNAIENNTRVSWGADVDTSARVNGFVLKWNGATKKHFYDTAGTGGGGSTYFAGAGLELSGTTFSIGDDSVSTAMVQDNAITYRKLQNVGANSVLARDAASSGNVREVSLSANQLLGRGNTGNVDAIGLNGLNMVAKTLTNPFTGTVTNIAMGNGLTGSSITTTGTVTLGTPSDITGTSTNSVAPTSHTHAFVPAGSSGQIQFNSSNVLTADADLHWDNANNRLGIGTSSPSVSLDVVGSIKATGSVSVNNGSTISALDTFGVAQIIGAINSSNDMLLGDADNDVVLRGGIINLSPTTRVGVGTTAPTAKLDVNGKMNADTLSVGSLYRFPLADGTSGQIMSTNGSGVLSFGNISINNSNWSGTDLSVANGGTGVSTLTGVVIGNGASAMTAVSGTANQVLRRNAANTAYEFYTPSAGTGTVTNIASGNGMNFSSITTTGTVTLGTPSTLTATSTNSVTANSHTHAIDFTTFKNNTRTFYLDTARVPDGLLSEGKVAITNQEKVIAFTLSTNEGENVSLEAGYYTVHGMVDIEVTNDDTTAGISGHFQNYQLNAYVTEDVQALGRGLSGTTTVLETAEANVTPPSIRNTDGNPLDGTVRLHLVTTPIKFYLDGTQFVALTIKATYPSPNDFVSHKRATMVINRVVYFDERKEQIPDIEQQ